jgi:hypothetical protein
MAASADELRQEMARIRAGARGKAFQLKHETKQLLEWKRYFGLFPWGILGAALLAGYFLVPTRRSAPRHDSEDEPNDDRRRRSSKSEQESQETAQTVKRAGLMTAALGFAGTVIYRAGLNYVTRRLVEGVLAPRTTAAPRQDQEQTYEYRRPTYP